MIPTTATNNAPAQVAADATPIVAPAPTTPASTVFALAVFGACLVVLPLFQG